MCGYCTSVRSYFHKPQVSVKIQHKRLLACFLDLGGASMYTNPFTRGKKVS